MENSNQPEKFHAISLKQPNSVSKRFDSDEAMTTYYLLMADTFNTNIQLEDYQEVAHLKNLQRKLRQFIYSLQPIIEHEWKRGVSEIQNACGVYMFQNQIERKELLRVNSEIGRHLQFITELAGNTSYIKQLYSNLHCHFQNVSYLLIKMQQQEEAEV